jgi:hypothetical protein
MLGTTVRGVLSCVMSLAPCVVGDARRTKMLTRKPERRKAIRKMVRTFWRAIRKYANKQTMDKLILLDEPSLVNNTASQLLKKLAVNSINIIKTFDVQ